jgi:hypothetical protein
VYVFEVAPLNSKTMAAYTKKATSTTVLNSKKTHKDVPPRLYRLFALYENMTTFIMPLCSHHQRHPFRKPTTSWTSQTSDSNNSGISEAICRMPVYWRLLIILRRSTVSL